MRDLNSEGFAQLVTGEGGRVVDAYAGWTASEIARDLIEQSKSLPAPCGCNPTARCHRHCRVKIRPDGRAFGDIVWRATCDGPSLMPAEFDSTATTSLPYLHDWATKHAQIHRRHGSIPRYLRPTE